MSDGSPKLIAIDEETNHHVVHALGLGKADRPAYQPLDPGTQVDVVMLKKSVGATPLNSCGFAVYSVECMRRRLQPQEPP